MILLVGIIQFMILGLGFKLLGEAIQSNHIYVALGLILGSQLVPYLYIFLLK